MPSSINTDDLDSLPSLSEMSFLGYTWEQAEKWMIEEMAAT